MTDEQYGKPTAKKVSGCGWWLPAVTTAFGPQPLPHGKRQPSAYLAKREAASIVGETEPPK